MLRTALKPGWLALLGLLIVVLVSFYQLGMWQLGVSSNKAARELAAEQAARPEQPLTDVTAPRQAFPREGAGLPVSVEGVYLPQDQFLVPDRLLEGRSGYWVVTPLQVEQDGGTGLLPVVRGFVTDPAAADVPGTDGVALTGTYAPSEYAAPGDLPEGQRSAIDTADLANAWDQPIYNGFIFMTGEEPALTSGQVEPVPPPVFGESGIDPRNVGYALQWFVFALFAAYMYYRFLRQATQAEAERIAVAGAPHTPRPDRGEPA
ncbi:SURF1 family protein [Ornithinimicrobium panacihumi]|uniref:SURF1 family protein n=1 Tax=Ornithinimicrobium panacihumi TaxID=2008449 RepID=UPI003F8BA73C